MTIKPAYFVTGTDTDVGKTLVSCTMLYALVQQGLRAAAMKPVAAGCSIRDGVPFNEDIDALTQASNVTLAGELVTPYLFRQPAAPHIVAALEGVNIELDVIQENYEKIAAAADAVVVEGAGGFRVPLSGHADTADMAQRLGLPVVLVVGLRLGCLNHALLTADAILARGLVFGGWVANLIDLEMAYGMANIEALTARLPGPLLGAIPRLPAALPVAAAAHLDFSLLPNWPSRANPGQTV